jgi:hypothetical protein
VPLQAVDSGEAGRRERRGQLLGTVAGPGAWAACPHCTIHTRRHCTIRIGWWYAYPWCCQRCVDRSGPPRARPAAWPRAAAFHGSFEALLKFY